MRLTTISKYVRSIQTSPSVPKQVNGHDYHSKRMTLCMHAFNVEHRHVRYSPLLSYVLLMLYIKS